MVDRVLVDELLRSPLVQHPLTGLTSREHDVLALMAEGRTDRGIAVALYLSRKTVETHVRSILRNLGLLIDASENRRVHAVLAFIGAIEPSRRGQAVLRAPRSTASSP